MSKKNHKHDHGGSHHHENKAGWKPHLDWRFWAIVLMIVAMAVYVMSDDEALTPAGTSEPVPAADGP